MSISSIALPTTLAELQALQPHMTARLPVVTRNSAPASSTTPAGDGEPSGTSQTSANARATARHFPGALYQASISAQISTNGANSAKAAPVTSNTVAEALAAYTNTQFNLTKVLQQLASQRNDMALADNTAHASENSPQTDENSTIATLQAKFESLLNTASDVNSQAVAVANSASPTLQNFVQTMARSMPDRISPVSAISPRGNLIQIKV